MNCCGCQDYVTFFGVNETGQYHFDHIVPTGLYKGSCSELPNSMGDMDCLQLSGCLSQSTYDIFIRTGSPLIYAYIQWVGDCSGNGIKYISSTGENKYTGLITTTNCGESCGFVVNFYSGTGGTYLEQGAILIGCKNCCQSGQTGCNCQ